MDIIEFAEKYFKDAEGNSLHLTPWQAHILRAFENNEKIVIAVPRSYGRQILFKVAAEWEEKYGGNV